MKDKTSSVGAWERGAWGVGLLSLALLLAGCAGPQRKYDRLAKRVAAKETAVATNQAAQAKSGVALASAARHALGLDPGPSPYAEVAKLTLDRSLLSFQGASLWPEAGEVLRLRRMVEDLVSTNQTLVARGQRELALADARLEASEERRGVLEGELARLRGKLDTLNAENAALANRWVGLKRMFWWIVWGGIAVLGLRLASAVLPPPYNTVGFVVDHVLGSVIRRVFSVMPAAMTTAKVVGTEAYETVKGTAQRVVAAIEEVKRRPEAWAALKPVLKDHTDASAHRPVIDALKREA